MASGDSPTNAADPGGWTPPSQDVYDLALDHEIERELSQFTVGPREHVCSWCWLIVRDGHSCVGQ